MQQINLQINVINAEVIIICELPKPKTYFLIVASFEKVNSKPIAKSKKTIPSSATDFVVSILSITPKPNGPIFAGFCDFSASLLSSPSPLFGVKPKPDMDPPVIVRVMSVNCGIETK